MKDLTPYLYPLLFAAFLLLNYVMQRIAKWQKQQSAEKQTAAAVPTQETQKKLRELNQQRQQLEQRTQQRRREKSPSSVVSRPAERPHRSRRIDVEPLEVRLARARVQRPELTEAQTGSFRAARVRALLADRRNQREAIVLTTVLGPCRAQE